MKENKIMKRCIQIGLSILLSILLLVLLNGPIYAQTDDTIKYWNSFTTNFIIGFATSPEFVNNQDVALWGFTNVNGGIEKQIYRAFLWGVSLAYRPIKYFDLFLNVLLEKHQLFIGEAGDQLAGPSIWIASGGTYYISPPLPHDIYYVSEVGLAQIGMRLIYPLEKSVEPYIGLGLNIGSYQIGFGNKDVAYTEILMGERLAPNLILGINFNILSENKILLKISPYFELGGPRFETEKVMHDWIWQGWTYYAPFPLVAPYRFGINLGIE
jgi:hypothetical protein